MIEFLLEQPRNFASKDPKGMRPRFIGFGFDYDDAQILKDLSYDKLWELQKGVRWKDRNNPNARSRRGQRTPWRGHGLSVIPGKSIKLAKLRDRSTPWKWRVQKDGSLKRYLDYVEKIEIEDAFGFFTEEFGRGHWKHAEGADRLRRRTRRDRERQKRPGLSRTRGADTGNVRQTRKILRTSSSKRSSA